MTTPPSGERKSPSEPSELTERKTNRLKRKDLRNAYKLISGLCLLFSFIRVSTDFGARHNDDMDLCGTDFVCANRLRYIEDTHIVGNIFISVL